MSFLDDIRAGKSLKKVPANLKNDRSEVKSTPKAASSGETPGGTVSNTSGGAGNADIKAKLGMLFGGQQQQPQRVKPQPAAPVSSQPPPPPLPPTNESHQSLAHAPRATPPPPLPPQLSNFNQTRAGTAITYEGTPAERSTVAKPKTIHINQQPPVPNAPGPMAGMYVRPPPLPRSAYPSVPSAPPVPPSNTANLAAVFERRFTFLTSADLPQPPASYTGPRTYFSASRQGAAASARNRNM